MINFFSNYEQKMILGKIIEKRKYTVVLKLEDGRVIIKKYKQLAKGS